MAEQPPASVPPAPSATILLLRDSPYGIEVFMVVRHHKIDFVPGALVFPGGKLEQGDYGASVRGRCLGADGLSTEELAFRVGAIREAYEECGVFLARPGSGEGPAENGLIGGDRLAQLDGARAGLNDDSLSINDVLAAEDLTLACDQLVPFAHWITPDLMPRRYDTHFFLAQAPTSHLAVHDGTESVDSVWINPARALAEEEQGKWKIIFPTRMNLAKLARFNTVAEALAAAKVAPVITVLPWVEDRGGSFVLCIPAEADYGVTEEPVERDM